MKVEQLSFLCLWKSYKLASTHKQRWWMCVTLSGV